MAAQDVSAMPNPDRANITGEENEVIALFSFNQAIVYFLGLHNENI